MLSAEQVDTEIVRLQAELCCAEDCREHRGVAEIRAEIKVYRTMHDMIPVPRHPQSVDKPVEKRPNVR